MDQSLDWSSDEPLRFEGVIPIADDTKSAELVALRYTGRLAPCRYQL